ncbi:MAG: hypothetical protein H6738_12830 [Alphaproteobacteria bacterium]|nr:hypothetical protein [Alphaproteobacteria bacterium]MCB9697659.1 hypothetical protein [Alphaproteobacteria bacterium]
MIVAWWSMAWGAPECAAPTTVGDLVEAVARAELSVSALDADALSAALEDADGVVPCLAEPLSPDPIARWYRVSAIHLLVSGDDAAAAAMFRAARGLQPAHVLDPTLAEPIREAWAAAVPGTQTRVLPRPAEGSFAVNGTAATVAPEDRPYVVQWFADDGAIRGTALVGPGQKLPFPVAPAPVPVPVPVPAPAPVVVAPAPAPVPVAEPQRGHASRGLALASLGTAVVAGGAIATAAALQEEVLSSPQPSSELSGLVVANRVVGYGAGGAAALAVGLGAGAVIVGRW